MIPEGRRRAAALTAVAAVFLLIAVLAVADVGSEGGAYQYDEQDLVGQWYMIDGESYNSDGGFASLSVDDQRSVVYGLTVYGVANGLFYGTYQGQTVTGSCNGGLVMMKIGSYSTTTWMFGRLTGANVLYLFTASFDGARSAGTSSVLSKDPGAMLERDAQLRDLTGTWQCVGDTVNRAAETTTVSPDGTFVLEQSGNVFTGVLDRPLTGTTEAVTAAGSFCGRTVIGDSAHIGGIMFDAGGTYWALDYYCGTLALYTFSAEGDTAVCEVRHYTLDGSAPTALPAAERTGSVWTCTRSDYQLGALAVSSATVCTLTVTQQRGCLVFGTMEIDQASYGFVCYEIQEAGGFRGLLFETGSVRPYIDYFAADQQTGTLASTNGLVTSNYALEHYDPNAAHDFVRHWYVGAAAGYVNGEYRSYLDDSDERNAFHLDIYRVESNTFCGTFRGENIMGFIAGDTLRFDLQDGTTFIHAVCRLYNSSILVMSEAVYDRSTGDVGLWNVELTATFAANGSLPLQLFVDPTGSWTAFSSAIYDGTTVKGLLGRQLTLTEVNGNLISGSMEQMIGSALVEVPIWGVVTQAGSQGKTAGFLIDGDGLIWAFAGDADHLVIYLAETVDVDLYPAGTMISDYRAYSRDGTGAMPAPVISLAGTEWRLVSHTVMTAEGVYSTTIDDSVTLRFTGQEGCLFHGLTEYNGTDVHFAGFLKEDTFIWLWQNLSSGTSNHFSYGWVLNDHELHVLSYMIDPQTGELLATDSLFVLSTYDGEL